VTDPGELLDHFFRHQYGALVASLTRHLGGAHLDLVEESVQEAMVRALRVWPHRGMPDRPAAWLARVARNHAIDVLRRARRSEALPEGPGLDALANRARELESHPGLVDRPDAATGEHGLRDEQLHMIFLCCHPALRPPDRVALTLKAVAGFSVEEIARAFFVKVPTLQQRLVRAKRTLREIDPSWELPHEDALPGRLDDVLDVITLVFNEGYTVREGEEILRRDLADEAIRLAELLVAHPVGRTPEVHALLALLWLQSSRFDARVDADGALLPLAEQDRTRWDRDRIDRGLTNLARAGRGDVLSERHLLAGIAACHAVAADDAHTDWSRILAYYDMLLGVTDTPLVRLNRAVALGRVEGPGVALKVLDELGSDPRLADYHLHAAARAEAYARADDRPRAADAYRRAATLAPSLAERTFLARRAREMGSDGR